MSDAIETAEYGNLTVTLEYDDTHGVESPREYEADSVFFGFHRSYASPDEPPATDPLEARRIAKGKDNICLPVWLYAHSGTCYSAAEKNPFSGPWDSGLFGFIYIPRADARKRFNVKRLTAATVKRIKESLKAEVEAFSQWANGEIYCWQITNESGDVLDSCGGYIGDPDYAFSEARLAAQDLIQAARERGT